MNTVATRTLPSALFDGGAWADLARQVQGRVLEPDDSAFGSFAAPANARFERVVPGAVVLPSTEADAAVALNWASRHGIPVTVRGGGHSYAGYSSTTGLLVHLGMLRGATLDTEGATVTLKGGMRSRDVLDLLEGTGQTVPLGRCPTVGIGGYTLGGGLGLHTRRLGMASDGLLSTRVVTASGEIVRCDENTNSDLFWACRGGAGGNFGINTSFTFRLRPAPRVTVYRLAFAGRRAEEVLLAMQELITDPSLLRTFTAQFGATTYGGGAAQAVDNLVLYAEGWYHGPQRELAGILSRVTGVDRPTSSYVAELEGLRAQRFFTDEAGVDPFTTTSVVARNPMRALDATRIVEHLRSWPGSCSRSGASVSFFAMGGADRDQAPDATAFVHRDALFVMAATSRWTAAEGATAPAQAAAWVEAVRRDLSPGLGPGSFVNFPDANLPRWWQAYYGTNYERLVTIKRAWDPAGVLTYPQGIRPLPHLPASFAAHAPDAAVLGQHF